MDFRLFLLRHCGTTPTARPLDHPRARAGAVRQGDSDVRTRGAESNSRRRSRPRRLRVRMVLSGTAVAPGTVIAAAGRPLPIDVSCLSRATLPSALPDMAAGWESAIWAAPVRRLEATPSNEAKAALNSSSSRDQYLPSLLPGWRRLIAQQQRTTSGTTSRSEVVLSLQRDPSVREKCRSRSSANANACDNCLRRQTMRPPATLERAAFFAARERGL